MSRIVTLTAVLCMVIASSAVARPVGHQRSSDAVASGGGVNWAILGVAIAALAAAAALTLMARRYAKG